MTDVVVAPIVAVVDDDEPAAAPCFPVEDVQPAAPQAPRAQTTTVSHDRLPCRAGWLPPPVRLTVACPG